MTIGMNMKLRAASLVGILVGSVAASAGAQETIVAHGRDSGLERWAIGLQVGPLDLPRGHLGIPFTPTMEGYHLAAGIVARWRWSDHMALNAGVGLPHSGLGASFWLGHELFTRVAQDRRGIATLEVYEDAGVSGGFAGPDYYARHEDVFVGYRYAAGGPLALGVRVPAGVRIEWLRGSFDTYIEPTLQLMMTPTVEPLFELAIGVRKRL
jgi:hypothetical protein